jgi:hypothetical protein
VGIGDDLSAAGDAGGAALTALSQTSELSPDLGVLTGWTMDY